MIANEFYMVLMSQGVVILGLTWINFQLHRRIIKIERSLQMDHD